MIIPVEDCATTPVSAEPSMDGKAPKVINAWFTLDEFRVPVIIPLTFNPPLINASPIRSNFLRATSVPIPSFPSILASPNTVRSLLEVCP